MPRDLITIERCTLLHPAINCLVPQAIDKAEIGLATNMAIRVVQGTRTFAQQDGLFALGRTVVNPVGKSARKPMGNIVTKAKAGQSIHNYGMAVDFALIIDRDRNGTYEELTWSMIIDLDHDMIADWIEVERVFESLGFIWGGRWRTFPDYPHLELTFDHDWRWFLERYKAGNFIPGTKFVKIN